MKHLEKSYQQYKNGNVDEGFIKLNTPIDVEGYINGLLDDTSTKSIEVIELRKTYPYNRSNPYSHDTYKITLLNGKSFQLERQYGRPAWSGNVSWVERISTTGI